MNLRALVLPMLALAPLQGQTWEVGLFRGHQIYDQGFINANHAFFGSPDKQTLTAIRAGYTLVGAGRASLAATLGYQPTVSTTVHGSVFYPGTPPEVTTSEFRDGHSSLGLMFNFRALAAFGAGVEVRKERIRYGGVDGTYTRPWLRVDLGTQLPTPGVKLFLGLEGAWASETDPNGALARAMAPKAQGGVYLAARF